MQNSLDLLSGLKRLVSQLTYRLMSFFQIVLKGIDQILPFAMKFDKVKKDVAKFILMLQKITRKAVI
jgi:hypothetical protein